MTGFLQFIQGFMSIAAIGAMVLGLAHVFGGSYPASIAWFAMAVGCSGYALAAMAYERASR